MGKGTCSFGGCGRPARRRGLCSGHVQQQAKGHDLRPLQPRTSRAGAGGLCKFDGCTNSRGGAAHCTGHLRQIQRGQPLAPLRSTARHGEPLAWLRALIESDLPDDCVEWPFAKSSEDGYGAAYFDGEVVGAAVLSLMLSSGERPSGRQCLHSCDNPPCINPKHLRWGTATDNCQDMVDRARVKGERNARAKLTEAQVLEIRRRYIPTGGYPAGPPSNANALAAEHGVTATVIRNIVMRRSWGHI